nr:hypothetical protein [uncultured Tolumonas sp.]
MSRFDAYPPEKTLVLARQRMQRVVDAFKKSVSDTAAKPDSQPPESEKNITPESKLLIFCSRDDDSDDGQC